MMSRKQILEAAMKGESPERLIGKCFAVKCLTGGGRWWVRVLRISPIGERYVAQVAGGRMFGRLRWVELEELHTS